MLQAPEPAHAPVCKFTRACLPANLRAGIKLPLSCTVASDLFELNKTMYLLVVDYFSRFVKIQKLTSTTSTNVITVLKSIFARHGIPATLVTDNGPQFISNEMNQFSSTYGFHHVTSSPHYHQSNGQAERMVKTIKSLKRNLQILIWLC